MSEMLWVCPEVAKLLVAAEMAASNPLISDAEWECPSRETALPFTVNEEALMFWKSTLERDIVTSPVTVKDWKVALCLEIPVSDIPDKVVAIAETEDSRVEIEDSIPEMPLANPSISDIAWVCPSRETGFPSTVMLLASIELKFNWSKVVAA